MEAKRTYKMEAMLSKRTQVEFSKIDQPKRLKVDPPAKGEPGANPKTEVAESKMVKPDQFRKMGFEQMEPEAGANIAKFVRPVYRETTLIRDPINNQEGRTLVRVNLIIVGC